MNQKAKIHREVRLSYTGRDDLMLWELSALCPKFRQAEALASKRWNVAKMLCSRQCGIRMEKCDYWRQFDVWGSSLATHNYCFSPYHMDGLVGQNQPTIILDELNPSDFIEQVDIDAHTITAEIARRKHNQDITNFLITLREVIENHEEGIITGHSLMNKLIESYGDSAVNHVSNRIFDPFTSKLEKSIDTVMAWVTVPEDYIEIQVDSISSQSTEKAWLVIIDNEEIWIPRRLCFESDIDNKKLMIPFWFADRKGIFYNATDGPEKEEDDTTGELPLNFLEDLILVMYEEFQQYKKSDVDYNSRLILAQTAGGRNYLRMNLRKQVALKNCRLICLDAFGNVELLSKLTRRQLEAWSTPAALDAEIIQITDGYYGITTMWDKKARKAGGGIPKRALKRLIKAVENITTGRSFSADDHAKNPEEFLIVTWKLIHQYLEKLQETGELDPRITIDHFGNIKGTNDYEAKKQVIIIGAPSIQPDELLQMAHAIWHDDDEPILDEMIKDGNWRAYQYVDDNDNGYAVEVREYKDQRLNLLLQAHREHEIAQAAHRIRPLLSPGEKKIWLLTNLPIDELPPTRLTTLDEIIDETNPVLAAFTDIVKEAVENHTGVWAELAKNSFANDVIEEEPYYKTCKTNFADRTMRNYFARAVGELGYQQADVTIPGVPGRIKVYHDGKLGLKRVRRKYLERHFLRGKMSLDRLWALLFVAGNDARRIIKAARTRDNNASAFDLLRTVIAADVTTVVPLVLIPHDVLPNPPPGGDSPPELEPEGVVMVGQIAALTRDKPTS